MDNFSNNTALDSVQVNPPQEVLQNIFALLVKLDVHGKVANIGGSIFEQTKSDPHLLTGQVFAHTVFWQSSENDSAILERAIQKAASGERDNITLSFRLSHSENIPIELYIYPTTDEAGAVNEIYICGRIFSKEETATAQGFNARHLIAAAEEGEIGLWFWDYHAGRIFSTTWCNALLGLSHYESFTYDTFFDILHPDDRERVALTLEETRNNGTKYEIEFRVIYPQSGIEWISSEGKSILNKDGKPRQMIGIFRKITEEKEAAEELAKTYERETRSREEAVEANRAKDFFLAFVSHELRSPLNAILGWSKILLTKEVDENTRKNALETIERSARMQAKLINDLVDSARVASGKIRLEYRPANLYEMLRGAYEAQRPAAESRSINLRFTADSQNVTVFADVNRMLQVFSNLLANALKFTQDGGEIGISLKSNDDEAVIVIEDNGEGISQDSLTNIFGQFSQGEMPKRRTSGGLGLGLSIAKTLVEKHGGSIQAWSEGEGMGSSFTITLPINNSQQTEKNPEKKELQGKPLERVRVMIVEDDPDSREVLQLFLQQNGASVITASDANSAKKLILSTSKNLPHVMISDLAMPDEDGYSLITFIRSLPPSKGGYIPAIALSAFATNENRQRAFQAGFQQYLTKPFDPELVVEEIKKLFIKTNKEE